MSLIPFQFFLSVRIDLIPTDAKKIVRGATTTVKVHGGVRQGDHRSEPVGQLKGESDMKFKLKRANAPGSFCCGRAHPNLLSRIPEERIIYEHRSEN